MAINKTTLYSTGLGESVSEGKGGLLVNGSVIYVETIADLQALDTSELVDGPVARIATTGRAGDFVWRTGNQSADVASDPQKIVWVAPDSDSTGGNGAWMRQYNRWEGLHAGWAGAAEDGVADETQAIQAILDYGQSLLLGPYTYRHETLKMRTLGQIKGSGENRTILQCISTDVAIEPFDDSADTNRVYIERLSLIPETTCAIGLRNDRVKSSEFNQVFINGFDTDVTHSTSASSVYNRYYNCEFRGASVTGVDMPGDSCNSNTFIACRFAANNLALNIFGSNQNAFIHCQFESNTKAFNIDGSALGQTYNNTFSICRFENNSSVGTIGTNGTATGIINCYTSNNTDSTIYDNGTRTVIINITSSAEPALKADRAVHVPEVGNPGGDTDVVGNRVYISTSALAQSGFFQPQGDDTVSLGRPAARWSEVFAANGTINTSDSREKEQVRSLSDQEKAVATRMKGMIRAFRWSHAVEEKGEAARIHFGVLAQDVGQVFRDEGLDPNEYGMFCFDEWDDEYDDEGNKIIEAGNRYGVRYSELITFIISAL